jgi:PAS domain S-box-containing protein
LLALISCAVFAVELLEIVLLHPLLDWSPAIANVVDALLMVLLVSSTIYVFFAGPMVRHVEERVRWEDELRRARDELDLRVRERTAALEAVNARLEREAADRRRAEEEIDFQARLLEAVEQAVVATGLDGRVIYRNRHAEKLLGPDSADTGCAGALLSNAEPHTAAILEALREAESWSGELILHRPDGSPFPSAATCSPIFDDTGALAGVVSILADISERKRAEQALRASEERHRLLVETMNDGFCVADNAGRITYANERLAEMTGYGRQELVGADIRAFLDEKRRVIFAALMAKRQKGDRQPYEMTWVRKDGTPLHTIVSPQPMFSPDGCFLGSFGVVTDISERKQAEQALIGSEGELQLLSLQLLGVQERERGRIARELHDGIGQTLTAIKFLVENALGQLKARAAGPGLDTKPLEAVVPKLQAAVEEVRRIGMALRPPTLDDLGILATIGWLCRQFQETYPGLAVAKELEIEEEEVPEPLKIVLYRVIQEAMNNAAKHSEARSAAVFLGRREGGIELRISDDGNGFDVEGALSVEGEKRGFGLGSMKERTKLSGGSLTIESAPGGGTVVRAFWPVQAAASLRRSGLSPSHTS